MIDEKTMMKRGQLSEGPKSENVIWGTFPMLNLGRRYGSVCFFKETKSVRGERTNCPFMLLYASEGVHVSCLGSQMHSVLPAIGCFSAYDVTVQPGSQVLL